MAVSSELTINYKMDGGENRGDCLEFRNTVSEALCCQEISEVY